MADGGYRDALTLLEQAIVTSDGTITLEHVYEQLGLVSEEVTDSILLAIKDGDVPKIMDLLAEVARLGRDPRALLESMMYRLADLTRASYQVAIGAQDAATEAAMHETAARIGRDTLLKLRGEIAEAHKLIRDISLPRLWLEAELVRLAVGPAPAPVAKISAQPAAPKPAVAKPVEPPPAAPPKPAETEPEELPAPIPAVAEGATELEIIWSRALAALPEGPTITRKARQMTVVALEGMELLVDVPRQIDVEWFHEKPQRLSHLTNIVREIAGSDWTLKLRVGKRTVAMDAPDAVELPAEGQRLEQLAREVFGA
jgi:DNA polymerase-3 subunit gamma/tau